MKNTSAEFIGQNPENMQARNIVNWLLETPGEFESLRLGAPGGEEVRHGNEVRLGDAIADGEMQARKGVAAHWLYASGTPNIDRLQYDLVSLWPVGEPDAPLTSLHALMVDALKAKLGKPIRKTKREQEFAWEGGHALLVLDAWQPYIEDDSDMDEMFRRNIDPNHRWDEYHLELRIWGTSPFDGAPVASTDGEEALARPDADAIKDSCNDAAPDCFDRGMKVTQVSVSGETAPYQVKFDVRFYPYYDSPEEEVEESFVLEVRDSEFHICSAAIESMGEILDGYAE